jgi:FKBP-type peptidyl-prolyl cis-trans isomerase 2
VRIEWGSLVSLDYEILLDSGEQVDSSRANGPLRLRVGEWTALPGLGQKLVGLQAGDERLIRLAPPEAFGDWDINAVLTMREFRRIEGGPLEDGTTLKVETEDGTSAVCRAYRVSDDRLALDFNHPLAGQAVTLFVRVNDVVQPA